MSYLRQLKLSFDFRKYKELSNLPHGDFLKFLGTSMILESIIKFLIAVFVSYQIMGAVGLSSLFVLIGIIPTVAISYAFRALFIGALAFVINLILKNKVKFSKLVRMSVYSIPITTIIVFIISSTIDVLEIGIDGIVVGVFSLLLGIGYVLGGILTYNR